MDQNEETQMKVSNRKPGRTLLVSNEYKDEINLEGLDNIHETSSGSRFLVFNSTDNARDAYEFLIEKGVNYLENMQEWQLLLQVQQMQMVT